LHGSFGSAAADASSRSPSETFVIVSPSPGSWWKRSEIAENAETAFTPGWFSKLCALVVNT